jgi:hypothetical protein
VIFYFSLRYWLKKFGLALDRDLLDANRLVIQWRARALRSPIDDKDTGAEV